MKLFNNEENMTNGQKAQQCKKIVAKWQEKVTRLKKEGKDNLAHYAQSSLDYWQSKGEEFGNAIEYCRWCNDEIEGQSFNISIVEKPMMVCRACLRDHCDEAELRITGSNRHTQ